MTRHRFSLQYTFIVVAVQNGISNVMLIFWSKQVLWYDQPLNETYVSFKYYCTLLCRGVQDGFNFLKSVVDAVNWIL